MQSARLETVAPKQRAGALADAGLLFVALCLLSTTVEAAFGMANALARAKFPFADNQWSEGPLLLQLHRMSLGQPAYLPARLVNSYDYGPVYLYAINGIRALTHHPLDVVWVRFVTMGLGLLTVVPLAISAILIARRAGVDPKDRLVNILVALSAATAGVAAISQGITFDSVHPDNLSFFLMSSALCLYYLIVAKASRAPWIFLVVVLAVAATFTKQSTLALGPALLIGLGVSRTIGLRWIIAGGVLYAAAALAFILRAPNDEIVWTFLIPRAHSYELTPIRIADCWAFLTHWEPFLSVLLALFPVTLAFLARREGARVLWLDGLAVFIVLLTAFAGFFKVLGAWNNLSMIGVGTVPYFAALLGILSSSRVIAAAPRALVLTGFALSLAVPLGLTIEPKQEPSAEIVTTMRAVQRAADDLCRLKKPIVVTIYPDMFFNCPYAVFALSDSYLEIANARPRYDVATVFDKPTKFAYSMTWNTRPGLPTWTPLFKLQREMPGFFGWGAHYFPVKYQIFKHR
jgi:hypothetical protein